jgi:uncharacterized protein (TIGR03437 family)
LNAASYAIGQPVTPGSLVAIFGTNLADALARADTIPLSTTLGSTSVTFNNIPAPLHFVSPGQINAQLPWNVLPAGTTSGTATLVVTRGGILSNPADVPLGPFSPGLFTLPGNGLGPAVALNDDDFSLAQPEGSVPGFKTQPSRIGRFIVFYALGLGEVNPSPPSNGNIPGSTLRTVTNPVTVLIGGVPVKPTFAGLAPQFVGVYQVNVQIPNGTPTGDAVPLQLQMGGISSTNQATIAIRP